MNTVFDKLNKGQQQDGPESIIYFAYILLLPLIKYTVYINLIYAITYFAQAL